MLKKDYMAGLEGWARWMLPRREAEEVIADYREIAGDPELSRGLARPRDAVRPLADKKAYRAWLAAFAAMAACLLIPGVSPLPGGPYPVWFSLFNSDGSLIPGVPMYLYFMAVGIATAMIWFRPRPEEPKAPLPRAVSVILAAELVLLAAVWWMSWQIALYPDGVFTDQAFWLPVLVYVGPLTYASHILAILLGWSSIPLTVLGIAALVKARTRDRRWRAVYVLSLAVLMLAFAVLALLTSMDVSSEPDTWWIPTCQRCIEITAIGLLGTGASLC